MMIRELTIEDYEAIVTLWVEAGLSHRLRGRDSRQEMEKQMRSVPDLFLGAFDGSELIGIVVGTEDSRKGWINRLAVHPDHRRKGVATTLMREVEDRLSRRGNRIIGVLVETPNEASEEFFSKMGYEGHASIVYMSKRESNDV